MPEIDETSTKKLRNKCRKLPCLWPAALSTAWHCAHFVLKIFSPAFSFPLGASAKVAIVVDGGRHTDGGSRLNKDRSDPTMHQFQPKRKPRHTGEKTRSFSLLVADFDALCCWRSACLFALWCSCALRCTRERCKWSLSSSWRLRDLQGFRDDARRIRTVGCLDENVVRSLDEKRERLLSENDDFLNTNMKKMFSFHPSEISPNHPTIQQLFIPSIISSSNYPTTFHPIYYFLIQLSNNFSSHLVFLHPAIQQLFFPSIISSSNYLIYIFHPTISTIFHPTTCFHPAI